MSDEQDEDDMISKVWNRFDNPGRSDAAVQVAGLDHEGS